MQDFIDRHMTETITLHKLAEAAGYSPGYSIRLFKEITGKEPFDYIRELRLARAAEKLRNENVRVVDVASDAMFDSHEGFTRAFSKQFGMSPRRFSKEKPPVKLFIPERMRDYSLSLQRGEKIMAAKMKPHTVFIQVVDFPARKLILKRATKAIHWGEYCEEMGYGVVDELKKIKGTLHESGGVWLPKSLRKPGTSEYVMGVDVPADYKGEIPEGYEIIDLKPCKMMVFQGPPFEDGRYDRAITKLWEALDSFNPELYGYAWADEDGPRYQYEPLVTRGAMEALPVRQLNVKK